MPVLKLHGKNAVIKINGTPLTTGTEWSLSVQRDYVDVSVYGDTGKVFFAGLREVSGSFAGLLDVGGDGTLAAAQADVVAVELWADAGHKIASGNAYVDCGATASVSDAVRVTGTIKGTGAWYLA